MIKAMMTKETQLNNNQKVIYYVWIKVSISAIMNIEKGNKT